MMKDTGGALRRLSVTCVAVMVEGFGSQIAGADKQRDERYHIHDMSVLNLGDEWHQEQKTHGDAGNDNCPDKLARRVLQELEQK